MSTIGIESWAVDLAEVGPIYPLQGSEFLMALVGIAFWIIWHRIQFVREGKHLEEAKRTGDPDKVHAQLERY